MDPTTLVLLPGLDGTGKFFEPLIDELPTEITPLVVNYNTVEADSYKGYRDYVASRLPTDSPYLILGESFSGPVAILLAADAPENCVGVILCCTFASSVTPKFLPGAKKLADIPMATIPVAAIRFALTNTYKETQLTRTLKEVLDSLDPKVISSRLRLVLEVDLRVVLSQIDLPTLVVSANRDKLVGARSTQELLDTLHNAESEDIRGPHFLLQTEPETCADVIGRFIETIQRQPRDSVK